MALLRSVATVGGLTLTSRLFGFVRDVLTAAFLGADPAADAFFIAQRLPNLFRSLFAEGAFSTAFVPLFAGTIAGEGKTAARSFAEDALAVLLAALLFFLVLGEAGMPWFIKVIAPGFAGEPDKYALTVALTRVTFPYLIFISLVSLQGGVLNSVERFAASAATPILFNLTLIAALAASRWWPEWTAHGQAWGIVVGGAAQFLWLSLSCARAGMALRLPRPRLTAEVRRLMRLMLPGVFGAGITQINLVISTALASLLPSGSVSYLYYADRLNQLPLGVVGIAVGTAILPQLSRQMRAGDHAAANSTQNRGIELALLLTLPAALALGLAARPILAIFERGHFGSADVAATAPALAAYALGLPAFVLVRVLVPAFYARQDTATPVKVGVAAVLVNLGLTLLLMGPLAHVGVALATAIAGWVNALTIGALLLRRGHFAFDRRSRRSLPRIVLAALGMGAVLLAAERLLRPVFAEGEAVRLAALALLIAGGLVTYGAFALLVGAADWREVRRRFGRQAA